VCLIIDAQTSHLKRFHLIKNPEFHSECPNGMELRWQKKLGSMTSKYHFERDSRALGANGPPENGTNIILAQGIATQAHHWENGGGVVTLGKDVLAARRMLETNRGLTPPPITIHDSVQGFSGTREKQ